MMMRDDVPLKTIHHSLTHSVWSHVGYVDCVVDSFVKLHLFETTDFLLESIRLHYTKELKNQAAKILGSVDFLGNPLGLFSDVAEGMSGLLELNIGGLLSNVTHGFSNTAAKVFTFYFCFSGSYKQKLWVIFCHFFLLFY